MDAKALIDYVLEGQLVMEAVSFRVLTNGNLHIEDPKKGTTVVLAKDVPALKKAIK